ncbi:hypothetical protein KKA85_07330 [bacterium]|nr:hypothetical protein [bacterium]MBU1675578.1 hypothetical protein [bacterium]
MDAAPLAQQRDTAGVFSWQTTLSSGYDTYVQTYALSLEDTTETLSEFEMTLSTEGRTAGRARHHWLVRPQISVGSERNCGRLEWAYAHKPDTRRSTLRIDGDLQGTWYNKQSDYYLTSDSVEGQLKARWTVAPEGRLAGELRGWGSLLHYDTPSELEADRHDRNVAAYLKSGRESRRRWRLGLRAGERVYPDTTEINRRSLGAEFEYDHNAFLGATGRIYHRSERRKIENPAVRPSSWSHWTLVEAMLPLDEGSLRLAAELGHESWRYDAEWGAYTDQTRWDGGLRLEGGGLFGPAWQLGAAYESLASDTEDESYRQLGARGGLEHLGDSFTASLTLEIGRRDYDEAAPVVGPGDVEEFSLYSDFTYVELWLMAGVDIAADLRLDVMASYLPESHSEETDDQKLGFGTARVVYRF